jgi:carboxyl-terminal processing protease
MGARGLGFVRHRGAHHASGRGVGTTEFSRRRSTRLVVDLPLYSEHMPQTDRLGRALLVAGSLGLSTYLALFSLGRYDGLFRGLSVNAQAGTLQPGGKKGPYALSKALVVQRTLELISDEYVDPKRVVPRDLLLAALNSVQRDVAQVLVQVDPGAQSAKIRVDDKELSIPVSDVRGPWDVLAKIRTVFAFLETHLKAAPDVDLRDVEYAACNGMLKTLDPHSVLFTPEAYKDFSVGTSGKFGGLGIVIAIRDKQLTVMNTMPGTPAANAGLQRFDRILQINGETTTTMGINDAVTRLRGDPKTEVTLLVHRDGPNGWPGTKPYKLIREEIKVSSVESKPLADGIAYVRLKQFAEQTTSDMVRALTEMRATGHDKGLVLDLRGNPGGLLDQARRVADVFVKEGVLVISDGRKDGREELTAKDDKNEPRYPIVVLINSGSASASEIVAGALKNLDRAVIVGETSFGKGSVQKVEKGIPPEGAALKLTIAQYLTPGDVSIQSVGITPDIELAPMTVDVQELDLTADAPLLRERDLSAHLSNAKAKEGGRPLENVKYFLSREDRNALRERGGDPEDQFQLDAQIAFSQRFLKAVGPQGDKRIELVKKARNFIESYRAEETKKIADELGKLGVDWSDGPAPQGGFDPSKISVTVEPSTPNGEVVAGEPFEVKVTVKNNGTVPLYRVRAQTKSDAGIFDGKEFVFGKIEPGKERSWRSPLGWCETEGAKPGSTAVAPKDAPRICRIPKDTHTRADAIKIKFEAAHDHAPADAELRTTVKALPRPSFAYSYQVVDDIEGNGDGALQIRERASMYLTVKNIGEGRSYETEATLQNLSGEGLLLRDARLDLSNMQPGEERRVRFTFDVQPALKDPEAKVSLAIRDTDLRESATERIVMPIRTPITVGKATGTFKAETAALGLFELPDAQSKPFGQLPKDGILGVTGAVAAGGGDWVRLDLGGGRFAFAQKNAGRLGGGTVPPPKPAKALSSAQAKGATVSNPQGWVDLLSHSPPSISVEAIDLVTRTDRAHLKGFATDGDRVLDAYVFVGSRKVWYRSNRSGSDPKRATFELDVPLRPGINYVSVWARENSETMQRKIVVIRRDGPNGEILETPKGDEELGELLGGAPGGD